MMIVLLLCLVNVSLTLALGQLSDFSTKNTWRCGVFIPHHRYAYRNPEAKYFVMPNRFRAECPASFATAWKRGIFSSRCGRKGQAWESIWSPSSTTFSGQKRGDQVCAILKEEMGMPDIPNSQYQNGVQLGFFYNYCGGSLWKDTNVRSKNRICCQGGKYRNCDDDLEILKDADGKDSSEKKSPSLSPPVKDSSSSIMTESSTQKTPETTSTIKVSTTTNTPRTTSTTKVASTKRTTSTIEMSSTPETTSTTSKGSSEKMSSEKDMKKKVQFPSQVLETVSSPSVSSVLPDTLPSPSPALQSALKAGQKLSSSQVKEVKQLVASYRKSVRILEQMAMMLEDQLKKLG